ncbi:MAG TPA: hypothetical protein VF618_10115 [Thermoanaerobaculia bacterium]
MRLIFAMFLAVALAAGAEEPQQRPTDDLVAAARAAKPKRKGSTTKVITNADVQKAAAKGTKGPKGKAPAASAAVSNPTRDHEAKQKAKAESDAYLKKLEVKVTDLETALIDVEQRYYDEDDPARRDDVIKREFELKKTELALARRELDSARTAAGVPNP